MAIKMRVNTERENVCDSCNEDRQDVLDLFDVRIGNTTFVLCDDCVEQLFGKCLKAITYTQGRVKTPHDLAIRNARHNKASKSPKR